MGGCCLFVRGSESSNMKNTKVKYVLAFTATENSMPVHMLLVYLDMGIQVTVQKKELRDRLMSPTRKKERERDGGSTTQHRNN